MRVAMIERDKVGGTCLHRGCIPTKALLHAAEVADEIRESGSSVLHATFGGIDMPGQHVQGRRRRRLYKGLTGLVKSRKIEVVEGSGRLVEPDRRPGRRPPDRRQHVLLATGSEAKSLPGLDIDHERVISSDDALRLDKIPDLGGRLGAGAIGCEFASVWSSFGAQVTIVEALPHLVPLEEESSSKLLERQFRRKGIKFELGARFAGVEDHGRPA